ncbi:lysophospholipase [Corynebacterium sp. HMSC11D10]|uniref:alpha/beta hydrolase n=1 Tax=Corynebacterium sp. HMSC11D10 TaxID=1581088 RepID=UPI0008A5A98A|nr:alpha/beta hydrolase [Corynebacterium sp. HMSC11D10]OFU56634.1 lysophospholipase [Corynebacterium sp. HMSC11D10]
MNQTEEASLDTLTWKPDVLGKNYEHARLQLDKDPDTGHAPEAVLIRDVRSSTSNKPAVLWVHGMSDYFFHNHVADEFVERGYPFYALDLRRCGRAHMKGQRFHFTLDMRRYFEELTKALRLIGREHGSVVVLAHSTGGLIVPLWADHLRRESPADHALLQGIALNSPWLDLQYPTWQVKLLRPVLNTLGAIFPSIPLPGGGLGTYGTSIHESKHGEWSFNTTWKPLVGHRKYFGWIRAVLKGQEQIHKGNVDTGVPTLTLCSSHSYLGKEYSPAADTADTVLDVDQIQRWAPTLGKDSQVRVIDGARHDVFLSERHARESAFKATFTWLDDLTGAQ